MNREEIKGILLSKKPDLDDITLEYYSNYFYVLSNEPQILGNCNLEDIIDNALMNANKLVFYGPDSIVYKEYGPDVKGLRRSEDKTIYVRDNLEEPVREMAVYHELHHAAQTDSTDPLLPVGISQDDSYGRMIVEAETQYFCEKVYSKIHNVSFEERRIPSENVRMLPGGSIVSNLHNYEMYDSILSKLSILLDTSKDFFVCINFMYKDFEGLNAIENLYNYASKKYNLSISFKEYLELIDYIYCVDYAIYTNSSDKERLTNGEESSMRHAIHDDYNERLSLEKQKQKMDFIDGEFLVSLYENGGDYRAFAHYIFDNETRKELMDAIETSSPKPGSK